MWIQGQWLWDREKKRPVEFVAILVFADRRRNAIFVVKDVIPGVLRKYPFKDASFWRDRFAEIYDKEGNVIL